MYSVELTYRYNHMKVKSIYASIFFSSECPGLSKIDFGKATFSGLTAGSTASYSCNRGFQLSGRKDRLCLVTGEWEGIEPTCARESPDTVFTGTE